MKLKKTLAMAAVLCSLAMPMASAQVTPQVTRSVDRDLSVPYVELDKQAATKKANAVVKEAVNSFAILHTVMDHVYLRYEVLCENDSYLCLLLSGDAYMKGTAHGAKEAHGLVLDVKTGKAMELKDFVNLPRLEKLKERVEQDDMTVVFIDRKQELTPSLALRLKQLPTEFLVDDTGCVYLMLTEQAHHVTDTPLLKLKVDECQDLYRFKG